MGKVRELHEKLNHIDLLKLWNTDHENVIIDDYLRSFEKVR